MNGNALVTLKCMIQKHNNRSHSQHSISVWRALGFCTCLPSCQVSHFALRWPFAFSTKQKKIWYRKSCKNNALTVLYLKLGNCLVLWISLYNCYGNICIKETNTTITITTKMYCVCESYACTIPWTTTIYMWINVKGDQETTLELDLINVYLHRQHLIVSSEHKPLFDS